MFGKRKPKAEKKRSQAELIASALKKRNDSLLALEEQRDTIPEDKYDFALNHIESAYLRDIADATR